MDYTAADAEKRFSELPPEAQQMLYSKEMSAIINTIGQKYDLHIDQIGLLNAEAGQVILGFTEPQDFPSSLQELLGLDEGRALAVAKEVSDQLFEKIRSAMKQPPVQQSVQNSGATPSPTQKPTLPMADQMLTQPTVTPPMAQPVTPQEKKYSTDPYREPVE